MDKASRLSFRCYKGIEDIPEILAVTASSAEADRSSYSGDPIETVALQFEQMTNCDPFKDIFLAEVDGEVVGYARCFWECESDGIAEVYLYDFVRHLAPDFRCHPVGETMLNLLEHSLRGIAGEHPSENLKYFQNYVTEDENYWRSLLEDLGYEPVHYEHNMLRLNSEEVPIISLPEGLEIRVVKPEHYRNIWESDNEAFQGSWGFVQPTESDYKYWVSVINVDTDNQDGATRLYESCGFRRVKQNAVYRKPFSV
jgi:mycothiol synthase